MKKFIWVLILLLALLPFTSSASLSNQYVNRMADAIKRAENSKRYPYGVMMGRRLSEREARRICINTIRNNHTRWIKLGKPGEFVSYLGAVYCPPSIDPVGHANWVRNVQRFMK
jgi:hypothetical protein